MIDLDYLQEFAKARFLVASKVPRLREHALHKAFRFIPFAVHARSQEFFARTRSRAMRGNDIGDDGSKLIDHLHREPRSNNDIREQMGVRLGSSADWVSRLGDLAIDETVVKTCHGGAGPKKFRP